MTFEESLEHVTPNQRAYLQAYVRCCRHVKAAKAAKVSLTVHYAWLKESVAYGQAFDLAKPIAIAALEDTAIKRANEGWLEPVFYQGVRCGHIRKFSDSLIQFLLKGLKPDTYRDRSESVLSNPDGSALLAGLQVTYVKPDTTDSKDPAA